VSIGRRLIDLARSELNSLLDRANRDEPDEHDGDPDRDLYHKYGVSALSDEELERELERRRKAREAAAREAAARASRPRPQAERPRPNPPPSVRSSSAEEIRRAYAALEVKAGSDFVTVRKSYRTLMRKYHPDRNGQTPEKLKAANELAAKLTQAYDVLERHLRK
jgi:curved DNA-binding protein CbpA